MKVVVQSLAKSLAFFAKRNNPKKFLNEITFYADMMADEDLVVKERFQCVDDAAGLVSLVKICKDYAAPVHNQTPVKVKFCKSGTVKMMTFAQLKKIRWKDLKKEIVSERDKRGMTKPTLIVSCTKNGITDKKLLNSCEKVAKKSGTVFRKLAGKFNANDVFVVQGNDCNYVADGFETVAAGANHDFHAGCHGLTKWKQTQLGDEWSGKYNLAQMIANSNKSQVRTVDTEDEQEQELLDLLFNYRR